MVYKTTPTVTQQGLSTVSVVLPYSSVVAAWERAGDTDTSRRTGILDLQDCDIIISPNIILIEDRVCFVPRLQSVVGSNPTQGSSFYSWSCAGCSFCLTVSLMFRCEYSVVHQDGCLSAGFVEVLEQHVKRQLGLKLQVYTCSFLPLPLNN